MFSFFKPQKIKADLSFIGVDMHSHLLPDLDDGLQHMEDTVRFIGELQELGYEKLICTPHTLAEVHPNTPLTILPRLAEVRAALKKQNINFPIDAASEYMTDMSLEEKIAQDYPLLTFGKDHNYILVEMSYLAESSNIENLIFHLQAKGLQPILAHPERYNYYHGNMAYYHRIKDLGCLMQSNLLSFAGYYGKPVQVAVEKLAKENLIDLLGTDMHHERHLKALKDLAAQASFLKKIDRLPIQNRVLFMDEGKEVVSTEIPRYFRENAMPS